MFFKNLQFKHKLYLFSGAMLVVIIGFHIASVYQDQRLSNLILQLSEKNQALNSTLINLAKVERLKAYIEKYQTDPSQANQDTIDQIFTQLLALPPSQEQVSESFQTKQTLLINSIKQYKKSFNIARKQIPRNFQLRLELRQTAQKFEEQTYQLMNETGSVKTQFKLNVLLKLILESERFALRFLSTDDARYIQKAQKAVKSSHKLILEMTKLNEIDANKYQNTLALSSSLQQKIKQTIQHYRTYSMVTKVILPGHANEISIYNRQLQKEILEHIAQYKQTIENYDEKRAQLNVFFSVILALVVLMSLFLKTRLILSTFKNLTTMFEKLAAGDFDVKIPEYNRNDEIGKLVLASINFQQLNLDTQKLLKETQAYKENLELQVQKETQTRLEQEKVLIQQSKLAAMGEMIGAIAHQWRQPLNELAIRIQKLRYAFLKNQVDEAFIKNFIDKNIQTINFMSKTIDDFRNFFRVDKDKTKFDLKTTIQEVMNIQKTQLENHNIAFTVSDETFEIIGYKRELQQALLNIVSNSKDALITNKPIQPKIEIQIFKDGIVTIKDNAGGIKKDLLERVFDPYFTTKDQGEGTGMGLYLTKMIIVDNIGAKLDIHNENDGLVSTIDFRGLLK